MAADGDWDIVVTTPLGERRGVLSLRTEGTKLLGRQWTTKTRLKFLTAWCTEIRRRGRYRSPIPCP
jgi:hypothetical protein